MVREVDPSQTFTFFAQHDTRQLHFMEDVPVHCKRVGLEDPVYVPRFMGTFQPTLFNDYGKVWILGLCVHLEKAE